MHLCAQFLGPGRAPASQEGGWEGENSTSIFSPLNPHSQMPIKPVSFPLSSSQAGPQMPAIPVPWNLTVLPVPASQSFLPLVMGN